MLSLLQAAKSHVSLINAADPPEAQCSWNQVSGVINPCCVPGFQVFPGLRGWWNISIRVRHASENHMA